MDRDSAISLLEDTFKHEFNMKKYVRFLKELFNKSNIRPRVYEAIKKEFWNYYNEVYILGNYEDDFGNSIGFYVVELTKQSSRDRARTMQRNLIASLIKDKYDSALVAFYEPTLEDWRFSHVKIGYDFNEKGIQEKLSSPRRHSFLVGVNEPNHTCQSQFLDLVCYEDKIRVSDIENAFSIENVTEEFFNKYKELFLDLVDSLDAVKNDDDNVRIEFDKKNIKSSDFAKKLMGQIVFIYFLQKKGWLGVERDAEWGTGPKNFFKIIFEKSITEGKNFFDQILEPLFYKGFSEDVKDNGYSQLGYRVPFLNGGLFEPINDYDWTGTDINLDNGIFKNIIKTFDDFNFTVKEDEPLEKEVAVDPEMLGKVFENLLEVNDRASKGAFYTPRHIVHYMCQETLINYLNTNSNVSKEDLSIFITNGDLAVNSIIRANDEKRKYNGKQYTKIPLPDSIKENSDELEKLLQKVKVIDPAVGSGAFPVGMMNEIVKARYILRLLNGIDEVNLYDLKRETIENSLYGVDIELSATDITKLRFWLSLIVDEEDITEIKPLPNLDNQIMCGNSLVDSYNGIKLFDDGLIVRSAQQRLAATPTERAFNELENKKKEFFKATGPTIKNKLKTEIKELKWNFIEVHLKHQGKKSLIRDIKDLNNDKPFIWELEFSEIFKGENPGFDIVIANPPYVGEKGNKETFRNIKKSEWGKKYYYTKMDLFYYFYHKALDISKNNGTISFITTNYFLTADGAVKLRTDFKERADILKIINFNELRIFESAKGQHNVITFLSKSNFNNDVKCYSVKITGDLNEKLFFDILNIDNNLINFNEVPQTELYSGESNLIFLEGHSSNDDENSEEAIISNVLKIMETGVPLKEIMSINAGADITLSVIRKKQIDNFEGDFIKGEGVFVLTDDELFEKNFPNEELDLVKPFIKNSDIIKFGIKKSNKHLIYTNSKTKIDNYPTIKKHLLKYKEILIDQMERYDENYPWFMIHRPREEKIFTSERIILPYRAKENKFAYSTLPIYDIKYILALLNSKLFYIWLYYRGKRKGDTLELYATPVGNIPIKKIPLDEQKVFIELSDKIISLTEKLINCSNKSEKTELSDNINALINELNSKVYRLYDLSSDEINIIENNF